MRWDEPAAPNRMLLYAAAAVSLVAGLVQLRLVPEHFEDWWAFGAFFLAAALAQSLYGTVLLLWPVGGVYGAGMAGNAALIGAHLAARSPNTGVAVSPLDSATLATGLALVATLGLLLASQRSRERGAVAFVPGLRRSARLF